MDGAREVGVVVLVRDRRTFGSVLEDGDDGLGAVRVAHERIKVEVFTAHFKEGLLVLRGCAKKLSIENVGDEGAGEDSVDEILTLWSDADELVPAVLAAIGHVLDIAKELRMLYPEISEGWKSVIFGWFPVAIELATVSLNLHLEKVKSSANFFHFDGSAGFDHNIVDGVWHLQSVRNIVHDDIDVSGRELHEVEFVRRSCFSPPLGFLRLCTFLGLFHSIRVLPARHLSRLSERACPSISRTLRRSWQIVTFYATLLKQLCSSF